MFKTKKMNEDYAFGVRMSPAYEVSSKDLIKGLKIILRHYSLSTDVIITDNASWTIYDIIDFAKKHKTVSLTREMIIHINSLYKDVKEVSGYMK